MIFPFIVFYIKITYNTPYNILKIKVFQTSSFQVTFYASPPFFIIGQPQNKNMHGTRYFLLIFASPCQRNGTEEGTRVCWNNITRIAHKNEINKKPHN